MYHSKEKYREYLDLGNFPESPDYPEAPSFYDDREDPLAVGRGILYGIIIGAAIWALLLAAVWYWIL